MGCGSSKEKRGVRGISKERGRVVRDFAFSKVLVGGVSRISKEWGRVVRNFYFRRPG